MSTVNNEAVILADASSSPSNVNEPIANGVERSSSHDNAQNGCLFVGDLSIFCSETDMQQAFQPFGEILEVKVMRCDETHKNLCYGFVKYASIENAQKAMDSLKSALLCGRPMRISWASHKTRGKLGSEEQNPQSQFMSTSSVHVSYSANQIEKVITEEILRNVFGEYGSIHDITIKKFEVDEKSKVQRGYGFVHFPASEEGVNAALKCAEELKDKTIDGIQYKCDISHKLLRQLNSNHPSHAEKVTHKHHHNNYHKQGGGKQLSSFTFRETSNHSHFQSQSSELTDYATPSIDLSSISFESASSMSSHYTQSLHPSAYFMAHPSVIHPNGAVQTMMYAPMSHTQVPAPTQQSSSSYIHAPYSETLYIDPHHPQMSPTIPQQQQSSPHMMYHSPLPGTTIAPPPPSYVYYPSPSTTPTSHYLRSLNPSGKAPFSSSTTTAMMGGDMKLSNSASSSNPATPTASQHHTHHASHHSKSSSNSVSISGSLDYNKNVVPVPSLAVENVSSAVLSPPISPQPQTIPTQVTHHRHAADLSSTMKMISNKTNGSVIQPSQHSSHLQWSHSQTHNTKIASQAHQPSQQQQVNTQCVVSQSMTHNNGSNNVQSSPVQSMLPPPIYVPPMMQVSIPPPVSAVQHAIYPYAPIPIPHPHQPQQQPVMMNGHDASFFMPSQEHIDLQSPSSSTPSISTESSRVTANASMPVHIGQPMMNPMSGNHHIIYSNQPPLVQGNFANPVAQLYPLHSTTQQNMLPTGQPMAPQPQQPQQMYHYPPQQTYPHPYSTQSSHHS